MLELRPNQDVDVTVKECFSLDKEACIIFQKYDEDWGEFIDVSIQNIQHKDKIQVQIHVFFSWNFDIFIFVASGVGAFDLNYSLRG